MKNLKLYNQKRNFKNTLEPIGKKGIFHKKLRFVVQHHLARKDHFDFRLEWNGVLISFAIPKGPSYNPKDKRLAIHVEDHPLAYRNFEGIIPQGEYGGGTVMLWDEGFWKPKGDFDKDFKNGMIKFSLYGKRLQGDWALVFLKDKQWLLIKEKDGVSLFSSINQFSISVRSGKTMDEIKNGLKEVNISKNRMEIIHLKENITLINDTYNANFEATESALKTLVNYPSKRKIAVLGDILEMEKFREEIHRKIGALDSLKECDFIFLLGENTVWIQKEAEKNGIEKTKIEHFKKIEELQEKLKNEIKEGDTILLKASHAMKFDQIVAYLKER